MTLWTDKWIGRPWEKPQGCVRLYEQVAQQEFGIPVSFPKDDKAWDRMIGMYDQLTEYFTKVDWDSVISGDAVLLKFGPTYHLGCAVVEKELPSVHCLHVYRNSTSRLDPMRRVLVGGKRYEFDGFYRPRAV